MRNSKTSVLIAFVGASLMLFSCIGKSQTKTVDAPGTKTPTTATAPKSVQNISQAEFLKIQSEGKAIVMDVRTPGEVAAGHIKGTSVFADLNSPSFQAEVAKLDKTKPYLVYCRSGARSGRAAQMMLDAGFTKVYNLSGGIMNWSGEVVK